MRLARENKRRVDEQGGSRGTEQRRGSRGARWCGHFREGKNAIKIARIRSVSDLKRCT